MKKIKNLIFTDFAFLFLLASCGGTNVNLSSGEDENRAMVVWTYSSETKESIEKYYSVAFPEKKITIVTKPLDAYQTQLDGALRTGKNLPDVVALEISFVRKYVESGRLLNLTELGLSERANQELFEYTNEVGTADDGNLYAISNQASPGGFFYRRSFADQLWGDDSPDFVQTKLSNWNDFLNVAAELKANDKKIVSNVNAAQKVFNRTREQRWVEDGKLVIDPQWNTYLDLTRTMQDEKYSNETVEYYPGGGWFSDISGNDVFGYFLAAWGLHYHLEANATLGDQTSENDWGFIQGPAPYFDGGTWFAGIKGTTVSNAVKDFLNYRAFDQDYLQAWALDKSDFSGNKLTVEAVENDFSNSFLQGQNPYPLFEEITESITGKNVSIYDGSIGAIFSECAVAYATRHSGYETLDKTWAQFKNTVRNTYPNIEIN